MKEILKEMRKLFNDKEHLKIFDEMVIDYIKKFYKKKSNISITHKIGVLDFN